MPYFLLALASGCSVLASIVLKIAGTNGMPAPFSLLLMLPYLGAAIAYTAGFAFYALALRQLDLTLAYPLMVALSILGIFLYGIVWTSETISAFRLIGAAFIGVGVFFVSK